MTVIAQRHTSDPSTALRWRLPNASHVFVGRRDESERLADLIARAPIAVIWGLGGLGKTTLALAVLHHRFPERVARSIFVSLRAVDASPRVAVDVLRALCATSSIHTVDWSTMLSDEQSLLETAIDLAEQGNYTIVLDDLHHGDPSSTESLLLAVNRYARVSRWVVTSRVDWALPKLEGQRLRLGSLTDDDLRELARALTIELSEVEVSSLVRRAAGSPWRMRLALGSEAHTSTGDSDFLQGLEATAIELLHAMFSIEIPLQRRVWTEAFDGLTSDVWTILERRGLIEGRGGGWRLHDMARALLRDATDADLVARLAERISIALAGSDDASAWLEAIRLSISSGALERALLALDNHGSQLLSAGYAPELWRLLEPLGDRRFSRWRLRCGGQLGTPDVLAKLMEPTNPDPEELGIWGHALFAMGRMREAVQAARATLAAARATQNSAAAVDAELLLLHAQALAEPSRKNEMLVMLRDISQGQNEIERAALTAKVYALMGVFEPALTAASRILNDCTSLPVSSRFAVYIDLLAVHLSCGRMSDARDVLARIDQECGDVSLAFYSMRYLYVLRTSLATHLGDFAEAHEHLDRILPFTGRSMVQRPILTSLRLRLWLAQGELAGIGGHIDQINHEFANGANEYFMQWGYVLKSLYDRITAQPPAPESANVIELTGAGGNLLRIYQILHRIRGSLGATTNDMAFIDSLCRDGYLWALGRLIPATTALLRSDFDVAAREAVVAANQLGQMGNLLYESESLEHLADIYLVARRGRDLARTAGELRGLAKRFPSRRLEVVADFSEMASRQDTLNPGLLETLAAFDLVEPTVSRRCRALLGANAPLDEVDRRVVSKLHQRDHTRIESVGPWSRREGEWVAGWGLDGLRKRVWLPDGTLIDFVDHPVRWAIFEAIALHGGQASREQLVPTIWPGETFDPLVHNNRLNPAIRKIRLAIERDPSLPRRLVTTVDGYGFGVEEPVRWLRRAPQD